MMSLLPYKLMNKEVMVEYLFGRTPTPTLTLTLWLATLGPTREELAMLRSSLRSSLRDCSALLFLLTDKTNSCVV